MANEKNSGPELSWQTIVGAITAIALLSAAQWTIFQNQFASVEKTETTDRAQLADLRAALDKYLTIREHTEYRSGVVAQNDDMMRRLAVLETSQAKAAHDPVEKPTFEAVAKATDDRITLLQNQITDINRQIAAALVIIDNNASVRKNPTILPP